MGMEEILTNRQKMILNLCKEKSYITIMDAKKFYSCRQIEQLQRLIELGFLAEDVKYFGHFIWTGKEY